VTHCAGTLATRPVNPYCRAVAEVDFMVIGMHASAAADGTVTVVGAGIDRLVAPTLPVLQSIGLAGRVEFTRGETDSPHNVQFVFRLGSTVIGRGGEDAMVVAYPDGVPEGWPASLMFGVTLQVPLTEYGIYHVDLLVDGQKLKTSSLLVVDSFPAPNG
jgi:hypothetical protein